VNGIITPFWIAGSARNQTIMLLQLNQLAFNTGLTGSTFE